MKISEFIEQVTSDEFYRGQVVYQQSIPVQREMSGALKGPLHPVLGDRLKELGITSLYSHQADAVNLIREGKNVILVSGTSSGKSLCYNIPVLESLMEDRKNTALYLFPTKALAQDQLRALFEFKLPGVTPGTYDGDTPSGDRNWIRKNANLVLSNPDMLHRGIMSNHARWGDFFLNLGFVVIDEAHTLRGIFGSNVANVIQRLRRLCENYGSKPRFVLTSATIGNPQELAENLTGLPVEVVEKDGSPRGEKVFLFWNPPFLDETKEHRKSSNSETTSLFLKLVEAEIKTIAFSKSRKAAELVYKYAKQEIEKKSLKRISSYRAGYLAKDRREIEQRLFKGDLLGVSSTNALELGIDVGNLDAIVINGFPGTIASTWQQAGRAGRRQSESLAILVGQDDPLDQYYMNHPEYFFGKSHEAALVDQANPVILAKHLVCAAYEKPLVESDAAFFGETFLGTVGALVTGGKLVKRKDRWFWTRKGFPAEQVDIRSSSAETFSIVEAETGSLLGTADPSTLYLYLHPGAVYLHQGDSYLVLDLDLVDKVALVELTTADFYTQPRDETEIEVLKVESKRELGQTAVSFGQVRVTTTVTGYQKRRVLTGELMETVDLDLPPQIFTTDALWFIIPDEIVAQLKLTPKELAGGIHAAEHASIALLPIYAMCDRWDIGGVSTPLHPDTGQPTIFIYDGYEGGVGIARKGYELCGEHLLSTLTAIKDCPCQEGCPSCIQSPKCGNFNEPLDKKAAIRILKKILP